MTIRELIERLQAFPLDTEVIVDGYETGFDPVDKVDAVTVVPVEGRGWWDGMYEEGVSGSGTMAVSIVNITNRL